MSKGVKSKQGDRASGFAKEIFGMGILLFSVLSLLCLITGDVIFYTVGSYVRGFFLGLFGYFSFAVIFAFCLSGLRLLLDRSLLSGKTKRTLSLVFLFAFAIAAIVQTALFYDVGLSFGDNFSAAYGGGKKDFSSSTVTGAASLLLICPLGSVISKVGCYVAFSLVIVLTLALFFKSKLKQVSFGRTRVSARDKKQKNVLSATQKKHKKDKADNDETDGDSQIKKDEEFTETIPVRRPEYMGGGDFYLKSRRDYNKTSRQIDVFGGDFGFRNSKNKSDLTSQTYGEQYKKGLGRESNYRQDLSPEANYIMTPPPLNPESIGQPPIKADNPSNRFTGRRGTAPEYDDNAIDGSVYNVNGRTEQRSARGRDNFGNFGRDRYDSANVRGGLFDGAYHTENGANERTFKPKQDGYQRDIEQRLNVERGKNNPDNTDGLTRAVNEMMTNASEEPSLPNMSKTYNPATKANGYDSIGNENNTHFQKNMRDAPESSGYDTADDGGLNRTNVPDMTGKENGEDYTEEYRGRNLSDIKREDSYETTKSRQPFDRKPRSGGVENPTRVGVEEGNRAETYRTENPMRQASSEHAGSEHRFDNGRPDTHTPPDKSDTKFTSVTESQLSDMPEEPDPNDGYMSIEDMPRNYRYVRPTADLLNMIDIDEAKVLAERQRLMELAKLVETNFYKRGVTVTLENIVYGMSITRFEYSIPTETSVKSITQNQGDIAVWLHAKGEIRIIAPIPGTSLIGIEVPNLVRSPVGLRELISSSQFRKLKKDGIYIPAGKNVMAEPVFLNLTDMPHLLIAGATGTGKSVFLNAMLVSLLYTYSPEDLRIVIVDPKQLEFVGFEGIPHLMFNKIITQAEEAAALLNYLVKEMECRYALFAKARVKKISAYNESIDRRTTKKLPYIIVLIDEFADLMMKNPVAKKDMDTSITRLAQLARAAGISLVFATQRPTTDVIDGTIKNNFPARICFKTADYTNSQVVLGENGAEKLLGKGDLLYKVNGPMERAQGALVKDEEIERIVDFVNENNKCYYDKKLLEYIAKMAKTYGQAQSAEKEGQMSMDLDEGSSPADMPPDYHRAVRLVIVQQTTSKSMLQTKLGIGYNKAARIIDWMESQGFISYPMDNKQREIRIDREGYEQAFGEPFDEDFRK